MGRFGFFESSLVAAVLRGSLAATFTDSDKETHTWSKAKPTIMASTEVSKTLLHMGLPANQLHSIYGGRYARTHAQSRIVVSPPGLWYFGIKSLHIKKESDWATQALRCTPILDLIHLIAPAPLLECLHLYIARAQAPHTLSGGLWPGILTGKNC